MVNGLPPPCFLLVYLTVTRNHEQIFVGAMMSFGVSHVIFCKCLTAPEKRKKDFEGLWGRKVSKVGSKGGKTREIGRILVSVNEFSLFPNSLTSTFLRCTTTPKSYDCPFFSKVFHMAHTI